MVAVYKKVLKYVKKVVKLLYPIPPQHMKKINQALLAYNSNVSILHDGVQKSSL